jgi:hypothetical protein
VAPSDRYLTGYDQQHLVTYLRLLDADAEGADWQEVAKIVLHIDPEHESDWAKRAWESHLARAKWLTVTVTAISCAAVHRIEFVSAPRAT